MFTDNKTYYKELSYVEWLYHLGQVGEKSLFIKNTYLDIIKTAYEVELNYVGVFKDNEIALLCCLFIRGNKVVIPTHYAYLYIWEKYHLTSSVKRHEILHCFLHEIQKKYVSISFRLDPGLFDIRLFIWNGFSYKLFYTYVKSLKEESIHHSLEKLISKPLSSRYTLDKNRDWDIVWKSHEKDMKSFGFRKKTIVNSILYLKSLCEDQKINTYNVYHNGFFLSSIITLLDIDRNYAYFPFVGTMDKQHYQNNVSAHLYNYALDELKKNGIDKVDFMGANTESIASYKSKFGGVLTPHYNVNYLKYNVLKQAFKAKLIKFLKKIMSLSRNAFIS